MIGGGQASDASEDQASTSAPGSDETMPTFGEAVRVWARIGCLSFGGPAAQIALMHREVVERGWLGRGPLGERRYTDALAFAMLLPGPEAMQLATYAGWRLHGTRGALAAGLLFVAPGAVVMAALAALYLLYGDVPVAEALFLGVKAAVLVIVIEALRKVAGRALRGAADWVVALLAFVAIFLLALPFPLVVLGAGLYGFVRGGGEARDALALPPGASRRALHTGALWLAIWLAPLLALEAAGLDALATIGRFFATLAVVTFGGAYAVLAYMAQAAVETYGWLEPGEMMDGLGLAETTPGPLVLVTEFVGFLAAAREGRGGDVSLWWGLAGALVTLHATFAPCFGFILVGAPFVEWIGTRPRLRGALAAITAAVVGVIANLSVWFALHVIFREVERREAGPLVLWSPEWATVEWRALVIAALAGVLLFRLGWGVAAVLGMSALAGLALSTL